MILTSYVMPIWLADPLKTNTFFNHDVVLLLIFYALIILNIYTQSYDSILKLMISKQQFHDFEAKIVAMIFMISRQQFMFLKQNVMIPKQTWVGVWTTVDNRK